MRKLIFDDSVVLDFQITNTLDDFALKSISIDINQVSEQSFDFSKTEIIEVDSLKAKETKHLYMQLYKCDVYSSCSFLVSFKYTVQEIDAKGNIFEEYKDTLKLEKRVEIRIGDYFLKNPQILSLSQYEYLSLNLGII